MGAKEKEKGNMKEAEFLPADIFISVFVHFTFDFFHTADEKPVQVGVLR